jgi:hypothetical protein
VRIDTIPINIKHASASAIDSKITYSAKKRVKRDLFNKKMTLIEDANVNYGKMVVKADSIVLDLNKNTLYAVGIADSTGKISGKPVFKDGNQEFDCDELTYNFKTKKAIIKNIITKQDQGLLHSGYAKLIEDGTSNIAKSTYSTCDADTPHFYIRLPKARVFPGKKTVSGPGNLVIEGIPLPLFIPFGYFPIQTKKAESGILIPRIGEERLRGYSLTEGGYYFAISRYFDLTLKGSLYANGTWMGTAQTDYKRLYKYSGSLSFNYANNISGHKGLPDYSKATNYHLTWNFNQDAKASPGSRFSASVNMSSSGYDKSNSYNVTDHITTQRQSSISYSKTWEGTPFNLSSSMNHSQNVKTKTVDLNLPQVNFSMSRIYPFKGKNSGSSTKWYQELQLSYSAMFNNEIHTTDSLLFTKETLRNSNYGFQQTIPLSFQIKPFKNFSISPSVTYTGVVFAQKIIKTWKADYINPETNKPAPYVLNDTIKGAFYGQAFNPSISASYSPQIFGFFTFKNPESRVQVIRHVIKPSVGFSFTPSLSGLSSAMYRQVQISEDTLVPKRKYSIYEGNIYSTPSLASKSGNISFTLSNIIDAKVFAKDDTTGKPKKIKIIEDFSLNTSYNIFADSLRWAPISAQMRTTIFEKININARSSYSLYALDSRGSATGTFEREKTGKLVRMTSFSTSLDFSLSDLLKGTKNNQGAGASPSSNGGQSLNQGTPGQMNDRLQQKGTNFDKYGYPEFNVPWNMSISYTLNYDKSSLKPVLTQAVTMNGNITVTKKMNVTYSSGYDFKGKEITMTNIGITRDLHCWNMSFNWVPNGTMQSWNFTLKVKASVLGDLKYERRKDFHDTY